MPLSPVLGQRIPVKGTSGVVDDIVDFLLALEAAPAQSSQLLSGLRLEWLSNTSIRIGTGVAVLPAGGLLSVAANIDKTGLSLSASTPYHVYLYSDDGDPAVEIVTTAPSNYFGRAWQKTGDSSRRYLFPLLTNGSGNLYKFEHQGDAVFYLGNTGAAPFRVANGLTATSEANVDLSAVVPVTARVAQVRLINSATNAFVYVGNSLRSDASSLISTLNAGALGAPAEDTREMILDGSRTFSYKFNTAPSGGGAFYADVLSYKFER